MKSALPSLSEFLGIAVALAILVLIGIASQHTATEFTKAVEQEVKAHRALFDLQSLLSTLQDAEAAQERYVLTGNTQYLNPYLRARAFLDTDWAEIEKFNTSNPKGAIDLGPLKRIVADEFEEMQKTINERRTRGLPETMATIETGLEERDMEQIRRFVEQQEAKVNEVIERRAVLQRTRARQTKITFWSGTGVSMALLLLVFWRLRREIAARQQMAVELRERTAQLEAVNEGLEAFSYSVSHDLRSPLRTIACFSSLLADQESRRLSPEGLDLLSRIQGATTKMDGIVSGLLELARLGQQPMPKSTLDMNRLAQEVVDDLLTSEHNGRTAVKINPLPPGQGNAVAIRQVLTNLLTNALKYSRNRSDPMIEVGARQVDGEHIYFVKDNGVGFDMGMAKGLFMPFQRLHSGEFEGTGVGLATASRIIQGHGGCIWAEGKVDEGAIFSFTLPDGDIDKGSGHSRL